MSAKLSFTTVSSKTVAPLFYIATAKIVLNFVLTVESFTFQNTGKLKTLNISRQGRQLLHAWHDLNLKQLICIHDFYQINAHLFDRVLFCVQYDVKRMAGDIWLFRPLGIFPSYLLTATLFSMTKFWVRIYLVCWNLIFTNLWPGALSCSLSLAPRRHVSVV